METSFRFGSVHLQSGDSSNISRTGQFRMKENAWILVTLVRNEKHDPEIVCSFCTQKFLDSSKYIWRSFLEWLDAYHTFELVHGVCIDKNFAANRFDLSLMFLIKR